LPATSACHLCFLAHRYAHNPVGTIATVFLIGLRSRILGLTASREHRPIGPMFREENESGAARHVEPLQKEGFQPA
jgi:hypothetical protein